MASHVCVCVCVFVCVYVCSSYISQALPDFMFVIDDISTNDPYKVGVMW